MPASGFDHYMFLCCAHRLNTQNDPHSTAYHATAWPSPANWNCDLGGRHSRRSTTCFSRSFDRTPLQLEHLSRRVSMTWYSDCTHISEKLHVTVNQRSDYCGKALMIRPGGDRGDWTTSPVRQQKQRSVRRKHVHLLLDPT